MIFEKGDSVFSGRGARPVRRVVLRRPEEPSYSSVCEAMKVTAPSENIEAIAAVFDLAGFTSFCSQANPATDIPAFLNSFLEWLFRKIEQGSATSDGTTTGPLWREPPFFAKFLGDGVLLLWDAGNMAGPQTARLMAVLLDVCNTYRSEFYGQVSGNIENAPQRLRCSVARGSVFSVNSGRDYVGHRINIAVRLQEYKMFSFSIAGAGFDGGEWPLASQMVSLSLPIRGVKNNELVWVLRREVELLKNSPAAAHR